VRELLERRHQLATELQLAQAREQRLPAEIAHTQTAKTTAETTIAELHHEQRRLENLIADHDRPLRRHRHQGELISARHHLADIPYRLEKVRRDVKAADETLTRLNTTADDVAAVLAGRGDIEADLVELNDQLVSDLRTRMRIARHEQPEPLTAVLGPRPGPGPGAQAWDLAAGRLAQHQAAFNIDNGLGPCPERWTRSAYRDSRDGLATLIEPLAHPVVERSIEPPELGLLR
jgi:hypothetical protein